MPRIIHGKVSCSDCLRLWRQSLRNLDYGFNLFNCSFVLSHFSRVWLFATLWTISFEVPLSMGFARWEYWSWLPCPHAGDLPNPGIKFASLMSPTSCGFRVTALVFCKRIATKSGFLPLWVLSHLLNETGSWPVWWVWPIGSMVKGSEPGGRVWEFREVIPLDPSLQLGNVTLCCGHDTYGTALPTYWLPGHPSYLPPNFILWSPGQWLSDTASSRWYMAISVNNPC